MSYDAFAKVYDALTADVEYKQIAKFIHDKLIENKPAHKLSQELIVDLACGTGNLSVRLAALGYDVIGVDSSYEMLSAAREKSAGSDILYLNQKMENLDLYGTVDAVICVLDSINHITDERLLAEAFRRVSLFLEPDGVFIFDVNTPYKHNEVLANSTFIYDLESIYCVWQNDTTENITEISLDFFVNENGTYHRSGENFLERAYNQEELSGMLNKSGLKVIETFDGYTNNPPNPKSERIVYVVKKTTQYNLKELY